MREITFYEAEDGTRFEDDDECIEYEFRKLISEAKIQFFNWSNDDLSSNILRDFYECDNGVCVFIPEGSEEYIDEVSSILGNYCVCLPGNHGVYYFDYDEEKWVNMIEKRKALMEELARIDSVLCADATLVIPDKNSNEVITYPLNDIT